MPGRILLDVLYRVFSFSKASFNALTSLIITFQNLHAILAQGRTLRSEDGDGRESVAEKVNSRSFNLHRDYSKSLPLPNVVEPSYS